MKRAGSTAFRLTECPASRWDAPTICTRPWTPTTWTATSTPRTKRCSGISWSANSPDGHFIIDLHPDYPQVSLASGFSGHGFKFASVIGEIMADLAMFGETTHDLSLFRLNRFEGF